MCCSLLAVGSSLFVVRGLALLFAVCCLLCVGCRVMFAGCCCVWFLLSGVRCLLFVGCRLLVSEVVRCLLFVVC